MKPLVDFFRYMGIDMFTTPLVKPFSVAFNETLVAPFFAAVGAVYSNYRGRCVLVHEPPVGLAKQY